MRRGVLLLLVLLLPASLLAAPAPADPRLVYNHIGHEGSLYDREAKAAFADKFRFVDVRAEEGFRPAREHTNSFADTRPLPVQRVAAEIVVVYVVTANGSAIEPRILRSTNPRYDRGALERIGRRRYAAARWRGTAVASLHVSTIVVPVERRDGGDGTRGDGAEQVRSGVGE